MRDTFENETLRNDAVLGEARRRALRNRDIEAGQAAALAYAAFATADAFEASPMLRLAAEGAKWFCLAMAVLIPLLLVWHLYL